MLAKGNADPETGFEYGNRISDGGFIIKFADGTISNVSWKVKRFFKGALNHDIQNPKVGSEPPTKDWWAIDNDSKWAHPTEQTGERVGPKKPFYQAEFSGAKFIWMNDFVPRQYDDLSDSCREAGLETDLEYEAWFQCQWRSVSIALLASDPT